MIKAFWIVLALQPGEFPSIQINNFMSQCGTGVRLELLQRGHSDYQATYTAVRQCACVLDKVRTNYTHNEFVFLSAAEQKKVSIKYAFECAGVKQEGEPIDPV